MAGPQRSKSSVVFFEDSSGTEQLILCFEHVGEDISDNEASIGWSPYPNITDNTLVHVTEGTELQSSSIMGCHTQREVQSIKVVLLLLVATSN